MGKKNFYESLTRKEILSEITKKKEFKDLPKKDVELVYLQFEKKDLLVEEKIKSTRDLLRKMYTAFVSEKLLNIKDKEADWFLKKHISTRERLDFYEEVYEKCLSGMEEIFSKTITPKIATRPVPPDSEKISNKINTKELSVVDFGSGINGFSYGYFKKVGFKVDYVGIEPVGQLVNLQNNYFKKNKISEAKCVKASLFDLEEIKKIVSETKIPRVGFFFKVLDSLEMFKRNYSKEVLKELVPFFDRCIVSWATSSLVSKKKFHAERKWLKDFIDKEFFILDEFEIGSENYLVFSKK